MRVSLLILVSFVAIFFSCKTDDVSVKKNQNNKADKTSEEVVEIEIKEDIVYTFEKLLAGGDNDEARDIVVLEDGFVYAGTVRVNGSYKGYAVKLNKKGDIAWTKTYGNNGFVLFYDVLVCEDGFIFSGKTSGQTQTISDTSDALIIKTDFDGNVIWEKKFGLKGEDYAESAICAKDGFLITGSTSSYGFGSTDMLLLKMDGDGNVLWYKTFGDKNEDKGKDLVLSSTSNIYVYGWSRAYGNGKGEYYLVKTDSEGNVISEHFYGGNKNGDVSSLLLLSDGSLIMAGWFYVDMLNKIQGYLFNVNTNGEIIWETSIGGTDNDYAFDIKETKDGFIIAGQTYSFDIEGGDCYLVKTDKKGEVVWQRVFGRKKKDGAYSVASVDYDGGYTLCGYSLAVDEGGLNDIYVIKTDSQGAVSNELINETTQVAK